MEKFSYQGLPWASVWQDTVSIRVLYQSPSVLGMRKHFWQWGNLGALVYTGIEYYENSLWYMSLTDGAMLAAGWLVITWGFWSALSWRTKKIAYSPDWITISQFAGLWRKRFQRKPSHGYSLQGFIVPQKGLGAPLPDKGFHLQIDHPEQSFTICTIYGTPQAERVVKRLVNVMENMKRFDNMAIHQTDEAYRRGTFGKA